MIIILSGALNKEIISADEYLAICAAQELKEKYNIDYELIRFNQYRVKNCLGCGVCMKGLPCPATNHPDDELRDLIEKCYKCKGFIMNSPTAYPGGLFYNMTHLWNRFRLIFEKEHAACWGVDVTDISENPFKDKPMVTIVTYHEQGAGKTMVDLSGRYELAFKFVTIGTIGIKVKKGKLSEPSSYVSVDDIESAKALGIRLGEILTSDVCSDLVPIICGEDMVY